MKEIAIKENHLFIKAYTKGKRYVTSTVTVHVLRDLKAAKLKRENPRKAFVNRIGFTASTKLGGAVVRNRCKRIMRSAYRQLTAEFAPKAGNLVVIVAREGAIGSSSHVVYRDIKRAFTKLGLIGDV